MKPGVADFSSVSTRLDRQSTSVTRGLVKYGLVWFAGRAPTVRGASLLSHDFSQFSRGTCRKGEH